MSLLRKPVGSVEDFVLVAAVTVVPVDSEVSCDKDDTPDIMDGAGDDFPLEGDFNALS